MAGVGGRRPLPTLCPRGPRRTLVCVPVAHAVGEGDGVGQLPAKALLPLTPVLSHWPKDRPTLRLSCPIVRVWIMAGLPLEFSSEDHMS